MKKRVIIIPAAIVVTIAAAAIIISALGGNASASKYAQTTKLEKKELQNSISVTGNVQSTNKTQVFSNLNYPIDTVNVSVGDIVKKGDVLCNINTNEIQNQILQQQAVVDSNNITSKYQLTDAEKKYQDALSKLNDGTYSQTLSAKQTMDNAKLSLDIAQNDYDNALNDKNPADTQVRTAELSLSSAEENLKNCQDSYDKIINEVENEDYFSANDLKKAYETAKAAVDSEYLALYDPNSEALKTYNSSKTSYEKALKNIDDTNKNKIEEALKALNSTKQTLENAKLSLESAKNSTASTEKSNKTSLDNLKKSLTNAQLAYETAKSNYNIALKDADADIASLKAAAERERTVSTSNDSQLILLESYKQKLEDTIITAPCDGTVTSVNAVAGNTPSGELFVIEDTQSLIIKAAVSEFDITSIELGMPIVIKSDAIKGTEYEGSISKISPTAKTDVNNSTSAKFDIEVTVLSQNTKLKIGMTAKLNIITEKKSDVFAVMYDVIKTDEDENNTVFIAKKTDDGYVAEAVPVTLGMESDFEVEISSDLLTADTLILTKPERFSDGDILRLDIEKESRKETD